MHCLDTVYNSHSGYVEYDESSNKPYLAYSWIWYMDESRHEDSFYTLEEAIKAVESYT